MRDGELFLCNAHMTPADQACTHVTLESNRTRKLLMHRREIMKLIGKTERAGYTLVPLDLHFTRGRVKVTVAPATATVSGPKSVMAGDIVSVQSWPIGRW